MTPQELVIKINTILDEEFGHLLGGDVSTTRTRISFILDHYAEVRPKEEYSLEEDT